jgi:hypothetical protein
MAKIKAPYRDSDKGYVYARDKGDFIRACYDDTIPGSRIISATRVERAVDDHDHIALCLSLGLRVVFTPIGVRVGTEAELKHGSYAFAPTVREAYHRYRTGAR